MKAVLHPFSLQAIVLLSVILCYAVASTKQVEEEKTNESSWQSCDYFFAPSSLPGGGWGAFAGRNYEEGEIVELCPRHIPVPPDWPVVRYSVLNDYIYGFLRWNAEQNQHDYYSDVVLGGAMFYNHHAQNNLKWSSFGNEPHLSGPAMNAGLIAGFVALRKIEAGEELFSNYDNDSGGKNWFRDRGLELMEVPAYTSRKNGTVYQEDKQKYCSKLYSGYGLPGWRDRILLHGSVTDTFNTQRLAPEDHPSAVVKQDVSAGTTLEMAPGLAISKKKVRKTTLAPLSFFWHDLDPEQQRALKDLRESGDLRVQHQDESDWIRKDEFSAFEDVVLFPAAGNIGMVQRVNSREEDSNCMLRIISSGSMKSHVSHGGGNGSAGILLQLVATRDLKTGEGLMLNVPVSATDEEFRMLAEELRRGGQSMSDGLKRYLESNEQHDEL